MSELSQHDKILKHMATDPDRWWLPADFMKSDLGSNFVGYEASARLSELAKLGKLESRRDGKYMARRLKVRPKIILPPKIIDTATGQTQLIEMPANKPRRVWP